MRPEAPKRAAVYIRLSDHRGEQDPTLSPQSQREACESYAAARGWEVVAVEVDLDETATAKGRRLERPGLAKLLRRLDEFDVIIARDLSRLARSVVDFATLSERCEARGVALVTIKENLDLTNDTGRFIANILAAFAEMEAAQTGWRQAQSRLALANAGRYGGGKIPFGLRRADSPDGRGSILEPDPAETEVIQRALDLALDERLSWYAVAKTLSEEGLLPRHGKPWSPNALLQVLRNPTLRGYVTHKGKLVTDDQGVPVRAWEPVISPEDWERLEPLVRPRPVRSRREPRTTILSGLAVCGLCGGSMHRAVQMPRNGANYDVLRCSGRSVGRDCPGVTVKRAHLEDYVLEAVTERYGWMAEAIRIEHRRVDERLDAVRQAIVETTEAMREPGANIPALAERLTYLHAQRAELEAQGDEVVETEELTGRTIAEALADDETPLGRKQAILADMLLRVEVGRGRRGRRTLDPSRFRLVWRADDPAFALRDALRDVAAQA